MIGPITVVSEGSIGSNVRRIEAVTGLSSLALLEESRRTLDEAARLLKVEPGGVLDALQKVLDRQRQAEKELQRLHGARLQEDAARLALLGRGRRGRAPPGRGDPRPAARPGPGHPAPRRPRGGGGGVAGWDRRWAWRWRRATGRSTPGSTVKELAQLVGGGGGGSAELAVAGGSDPTKIDDPAGGGASPARCLTPAGGLSAVRVVGVDLGERRIGVAVSDGTGTLASPRTTIERSAQRRRRLERAGGRGRRGRGAIGWWWACP